MASEQYSLLELCSVIVDNRGKTCPVGDAGRPLIATNCVKNSALYPSYQTERFVSEETYASWFRAHPKPGDLIFVTKGSPGQVCIAPDPVDFCIAQDMVALRANESLVYPPFLFALLRSSETQNQIGNMHVGSLIPHFKKGDFDKLFLTIPEEHEQLFIGDFYLRVSERIHRLNSTNDLLESIARAIFKSWFVDFDPVRAKAEGREPEGMDADTAALFPSDFDDTEYGAIPFGWSVRSLTEFMFINPPRSLPKGKEAPYLEMANAPTMGPRPSQWINRMPISGCRFRNGDTLLAKITPCLENGKTAFVDFLDEDAVGWGSTEFVVLAPKEPVPPVFGYLLARDAGFRSFAIQSMSGTSGRQRVQVDQLANFKFPYATEAVYKAFGEIVEPLFAAISHNDNQAKTLADLRDTLLPRLISGKLRVPEAEAMLTGGCREV